MQAGALAGGRRAEQPLSQRDLRKAAVVCCVSCLSLGLTYYVASRASYAHLYQDSFRDAYGVLRSFAWWAGWTFAAFALLPALSIVCILRERLSDYHLTFHGLRSHGRWYAALLLGVLPIVGVISQTSAFLSYYPMYRLAGRSWFDFLVWEALYASQFVAVEFFFRGFLLRGLTAHFGFAAIFVATIPYVMIHFGKPWPEAAAAFFAGSALGWLAVRTGSIWGGVAVHVAVAWTMDVLALVNKGQGPWRQGYGL